MPIQGGEIIGIYYSYYCFIITIFIAPFTFTALLFFNRETFEKESFKNVWGSFYENINTRKKINLFNNLLFILRRLIFFSTAFFLIKYPSVQLIITI